MFLWILLLNPNEKHFGNSSHLPKYLTSKLHRADVVYPFRRSGGELFSGILPKRIRAGMEVRQSNPLHLPCWLGALGWIRSLSSSGRGSPERRYRYLAHSGRQVSARKARKPPLSLFFWGNSLIRSCRRETSSVGCTQISPDNREGRREETLGLAKAFPVCEGSWLWRIRQ